MKKKLSVILAAILIVMAAFSGCESAPSGSADPGSAEPAAGASGDQAILVVSFGTSYNDSRDKTIGAIEDAIAAEFPDYEHCWEGALDATLSVYIGDGVLGGGIQFLD